jgi:hypothetical protein
MNPRRCRSALAAIGLLPLLGAAPTASAQGLGVSHPALVFLAPAGGPSPAPQVLEILSTPPGAPGWSISPTPPAPAWLTIAPTSGTAPGTATLTANSAGLSPGVYHFQLTVTSGSETRTVEVFLVVTDANGGVSLPPNIPIPPLPPAAPPARYLVEFHFVGYAGLLDGYPQCKVNPNGRDLMFGVLSGTEPTEASEDAEYTGTLTRYTMMDFCDIKPRRGKPDEHDWCEMWMAGASKMAVTLDVYGDDGRGAWLKAKGISGGVFSLNGTCDTPVAQAIRADYPMGSSGGGGSPSGQAIQDPRSRLYSQERARLRLGDWPVVDKDEGGWSMRVLARLNP